MEMPLGQTETLGQGLQLSLRPENQILWTDQTDDPSKIGIPSQVTQSTFGSPQAYGGTGLAILGAAELNRFKLGPGFFLSNKVLGPLGTLLGSRLGLNLGPFASEVAYQIEFLANIRLTFPLIRAYEMGSLTVEGVPERIIGQAWGLHGNVAYEPFSGLQSVAATLGAFGAYGVTQTLFQREFTNALDRRLVNGALREASAGRFLLEPVGRFLSQPMVSRLGCTAATGYLGAPEMLLRGYALARVGGITLGATLGWPVFDLTLSSLDSNRLPLYYESPEQIADRYTNDPFVGTIIGFTIGGHLGFAIGQIVGTEVVERAGRLVPISLLVKILPNELLTPEQVDTLASQSGELATAARVTQDTVKIPLLPEDAHSGVYLDKAVGARTRGHLVWLALDQDHADANPEHSRWLQRVQPEMLAHLDLALGHLSEAYAKLQTALDQLIFNLGGDETETNPWQKDWDAAKSNAERQRILGQMQTSLLELRAQFQATRAALEKAIDELRRAPFQGKTDPDKPNEGKTQAFKDGVISSTDVLEKQIAALQKTSEALSAAERQITGLLERSPSLGEWVSEKVSAFFDDPRERAARERRVLEQQFQESLRLHREAGLETVKIISAAQEGPLGPVAQRMRPLLGGHLSPELAKAVTAYQESVAKLRVQLAALEAGAKEALKEDEIEKRRAGTDDAHWRLTQERDALETQRIELERRSGRESGRLRQLHLQQEALQEQKKSILSRDPQLKRSGALQAVIDLNREIAKKSRQIFKLQYPEGKDGHEARFVEVPAGSNHWQSRELAQVNVRLQEIYRGQLTPEAASVVVREQSTLSGRLQTVQSLVGESIQHLEKAIQEAHKNGASPEVMVHLQRTLSQWQSISAKLGDIAQTGGNLNAVLESPEGTALRNLIFRSAGRGLSGLVKTGTMVSINLGLGFAVSKWIEGLSALGIFARPIPGTLPASVDEAAFGPDLNIAPEFLFGTSPSGGSRHE